MLSAASLSERKVLILCIDRDDDIGDKTGRRTPIIGRDKVLSAAVDLALSDPEETDANAMFESVRLSDELSKRGVSHLLAVVSGSKEGGITADRKLLSEVKSIASSFNPNETIVITDGFGDEDVIPVLKANLPLTSIRRVVVKHSRSVEESYIILGRYAKMLVTDPRFKKWFLGLPGLAFLLLGVAPREAISILLGVIGIVAVIKGFDIDVKISSYIMNLVPRKVPSHLSLIRIFTFFLGLSIIVFWSFLGVLKVSLLYPSYVTSLSSIISHIGTLMGEWIRQSIDAVVWGIVIIYLGKVICSYRVDTESFTDGVFWIVVVLLLYPMFYAVSGVLLTIPGSFLELLKYSFIALVGILISLVSISFIRGYRIKKTKSGRE